MRIFFDNDRRCLFINGTREVYPARSLTHMDDGEKISIWIANQQTQIVKIRWQNIQNYNGNGFNDIESVRQYLTQEFSKGDDLQDIESADFVATFEQALL